MSDRIVIDPEGLRRMAARMRGAALLLLSTRRELASRSLPPMPSAVAALVAESLERVDAEVQDLAAGLVRDAGHLLARATWAEVGGGGPGVWSSYGASGPLLDTAAADTAAVDTPTRVSVLSDEQVAHAEGWALERVEAAEVASPDEDASGLRGAVAEDLAPTSDDAQRAPLGELTLTASDLAVEDGGLAGPVPSPDTGGGALGNAFREVASTPTGAGILGCLAVGLGTTVADRAPGEGS